MMWTMIGGTTEVGVVYAMMCIIIVMGVVLCLCNIHTCLFLLVVIYIFSPQY